MEMEHRRSQYKMRANREDKRNPERMNMVLKYSIQHSIQVWPLAYYLVAR